MEVQATNTQASAYASYAKSAGKAGKADAAAANAKNVEGASGANFGSAYDVDISDAAKTKTKGLAADEVKALKSAVENSYSLMIQTMTNQNNKLQSWLDDGIGKLNFGGVTIDASRFALPEVATTPEDAAKATAEGGEWSVNAVSDRIFGLATALAGDDPEKLSQMQDAIKKGFEQAGLEFKKTTGAKDMPQITKDTFAEITKRFDELYKKLGVKGGEDEEKAASGASL